MSCLSPVLLSLFCKEYEPKGSKVRNNRVFRVSMSGNTVMVWGRCLIVGYLDR